MKVALLTTCLADWFRPDVAMASIKVLEYFGCQVEVPEHQTCCGQPAYSNGYDEFSRSAARHTIMTFESYDYIVIPSGSCTGMIMRYQELFREDPLMKEKAASLQKRTFEFCQFMVNILQIQEWPSRNDTDNGTNSSQESGHCKITYHDSCAGLREVGIKEEPRKLLKISINVDEKIVPLQGEEECCGFGGSFAVKYGEISSAIAEHKCTAIANTGAQQVLMGDLGCILNIAGKCQAIGIDVEVLHIAQWLASRLPGRNGKGRENPSSK